MQFDTQLWRQGSFSFAEEKKIASKLTGNDGRMSKRSKKSKHESIRIRKFSTTASPQYNDCTPNNGSISVVDKIYMSRTISSARWCRWFRHSCTAALGTRLHDLHQVELKTAKRTGRIRVGLVGASTADIYLWESCRDPWKWLLRCTMRREKWEKCHEALGLMRTHLARSSR